MRAIKKQDHIPPDTNKDGLNATIPPPLRKHTKLNRIDLAIGLINERKIYTGEEVNGGGSLGVVFTAMDLQTVDAVLVDGL
jgi:hypothetical protein